MFGIFGSSSTDEYDKFINKTTSTTKTPWEYLPNKEVGYCVNTDIDKNLKESILETYCAQKYEAAEKFSNCFHNKFELMTENAQRLAGLSQMIQASSLNRISDYEAADRATILLCSLKTGNIYKLDKNYLKKDIEKIKEGKEEAKELKVSYKCLIAYKKGITTTECSEKEIKNIQGKYPKPNTHNEEKAIKQDTSDKYEMTDFEDEPSVENQPKQINNETEQIKKADKEKQSSQMLNVAKNSNAVSDTIVKQNKNSVQVPQPAQQKAEVKPAQQNIKNDIDEDVDDFMN